MNVTILGGKVNAATKSLKGWDIICTREETWNKAYIFIYRWTWL